MIAVARLVSGLALAGTILPPLLFAADRMTLDQSQSWMLVAAVAWFASAPVWMEHRTGR